MNFSDDEAPECKIHSVQVNPCKEAVSNMPCKLKKEEYAHISFNYTACE